MQSKYTKDNNKKIQWKENVIHNDEKSRMPLNKLTTNR